jgi:cytochrome c oxidase cbb3-type subunit 3
MPIRNLSRALLAAPLLFGALLPAAFAQNPAPDLLASGKSLFLEKCGFCHGTDAAGGEGGPDLTRSSLVSHDTGGDRIGPVVREGRQGTSMPAFQLSDAQMSAVVAFIHNSAKNGQRRGVDEADLQAGNAEAGKQYFNGAGKCASCHSPTGDFAGLANRLKGLRLEQRMLYPNGAKAKVTVTLPSGKTIEGTLASRDEFVIAMKDADGWYRSWPTDQVKFTIDAPAEAHAELLPKYTDADIHNLMAYLQTLR